ncbi:methyl-accepting chemotaxis protein [Novosphingobium sp. G106]|uniref:methyl-accepting chemotaxis protein n=1 Tax=Novosphingobium sp. G106 TaxID=2849500 RepID=UPI0020C30C80|nr:methyl-accepting chemotaxis protein [Novosphingobium sp. G106]
MPEVIAQRKRNWFDRQSIVMKMRVIICVFLVLSLIIATAGWVVLSQVQYRAQNLARLNASAQLVSDAGGNIARAVLQLESGDAKRSDAARALLGQAGDSLAKARRALDDADPELDQAFDSLDRNLAGFTASAATGSSQAEGLKLADEANTIENSLTVRATAIQRSSDSFISWSQIVTIAFALIAAINGLLALGFVRMKITEPLVKMTKAMLSLADGNKELVVEGTDEANEIGDMARSLEIFRMGYLKLDKMRTEAAEAAKAEIARQEEIRLEREEMQTRQTRELLQIADNFEQTVGEVVSGVAAASSQLQLTASSMAAAAEQSVSQIGEVSSAMNEASAGVTAGAAASDEFAMSISEISRQAANSAELARKATMTANNADATISELAVSAEQVGQIVKLISTIAQRTNLLALNASIEAARGGEAGRGFAVVASEVKELAAQTSRATDEVAQQIQEIQESTMGSVAALRAIAEDIGELEATAVSIAAAVDQQSVAGQDLARSIDLAARSTDDVTSNIEQVRETSLATGAAASQVLTSSTDLQDQAARLKGQVDQFLQHVRATDRRTSIRTELPEPVLDQAA